MRERERGSEREALPPLPLSLFLSCCCCCSSLGNVQSASLAHASTAHRLAPSRLLPLAHPRFRLAISLWFTKKKGYQFQDWSQQKPPQRKVSQEIPLAQKQKSKKSVSERGKKMLSHRFYTLTNSSCCLCCCCYSCSLCCPY